MSPLFICTCNEFDMSVAWRSATGVKLRVATADLCLSLHLARKYARIFVCGQYPFREANSFPRVKLEENSELRGTDMSMDKYPSIFSQPNWGYCVYYPSVLKTGEYPRIFPSFGWGIFAHVTRLNQWRATENIWWIINIFKNYYPTRARWIWNDI